MRCWYIFFREILVFIGGSEFGGEECGFVFNVNVCIVSFVWGKVLCCWDWNIWVKFCILGLLLDVILFIMLGIEKFFVICNMNGVNDLSEGVGFFLLIVVCFGIEIWCDFLVRKGLGEVIIRICWMIIWDLFWRESNWIVIDL